MGDSRNISFLERREAKHKPHPGLWLFVAISWVLIGLGGLLILVVPHGHHGDVVLAVILVVGGAVNVPIALWRRGRDQRRQGTWMKPV